VSISLRCCFSLCLLAALAPHTAFAEKPENVLVVANHASPVSKSIAEYYARKRSVPLANICYINTTTVEHIPLSVYTQQIAAPVMKCLTEKGLTEKILYIVTTLGVPLGIDGDHGPQGDAASVDSELALLYRVIHGQKYERAGAVPNPFYRQQGSPFAHTSFPIYLVTRLAAYDFATVRGMIDRSLIASNKGMTVLDLQANGNTTGDEWLRDAAIRLPAGRVLLEEATTPVYRQKDVIAYGSWGSNDRARKERFLRFQWLPGAIASDFVSSNGRTFDRPPDNWTLSTWAEADKPKWFKGSPQSLAADYLMEGATGASGHVYEPFLGFCPRPEYLFPAYIRDGRNLAESFYIAIPALSWRNIVLGDPLCRVGPQNNAKLGR
jgi:uncharacterized protein (TIGR03790 family)